MAASGLGGSQYRRRDGASGGTFHKQARQQGTGGGGSQVGKKKAVTGVKGAHKPGAGKAKRKWRPVQPGFAGSAKEGKGFALWRKQKVQLEYKKLQRKQKKATATKDLYADSYPEHLKHLYLAEEERLKDQDRKRKPEEDTTQTTEEEEVVIPKKKFKNKTSNQKAKEEYEQVQRERAKKRKEAEENRKKRDEARELYKKKKMEAYKVLNTKTKKGQPNFNVQMEYLLKKIQSKT